MKKEYWLITQLCKKAHDAAQYEQAQIIFALPITEEQYEKLSTIYE